MDREGFRGFLQQKELDAEEIASFLALVEEYESSLAPAASSDLSPLATAEAVQSFSRRLVREGRNVFDHYRALALYGRFSGNDALYVAVVELVDGAEALENLYHKLGQTVGEEVRDAVFAGVELPPMGTPSVDKPAITRQVMERLEAAVEPQTCRQILSGGLRDLQDEWFLESKELYEESADLDDYLERKGKAFLAQLEEIRAEGGLFFTQEITPEVIDFVRSTPEVGQGVREGDIVYEVKIPYMTAAWLAETDERMKRYYYCHCPWVREALREGEPEISPTFCLCSAGFHKKPWEVIFGRPLQAEIVESVLQGDRWCKIAIHLPEENYERPTLPCGGRSDL